MKTHSQLQKSFSLLLPNCSQLTHNTDIIINQPHLLVFHSFSINPVQWKCGRHTESAVMELLLNVPKTQQQIFAVVVVGFLFWSVKKLPIWCSVQFVHHYCFCGRGIKIAVLCVCDSTCFNVFNIISAVHVTSIPRRTQTTSQITESGKSHTDTCRWQTEL